MPRSPELTAAAALLGASAALAAWGDALGRALVTLIRAPLSDGAALVAASDPLAVVDRLREAALTVVSPMVAVLASAFFAALAAHQAQVRGLWSPGLLAPDPSRLWSWGRGPDASSRVGRGSWALVKAVVVGAVAFGVIRNDWRSLQRLGELDAPQLATAAALAVRNLALGLAFATLALGLVDFALTWFRFEAMLRTSPEEAREEMRSAEGDPVLRARRRRLASAWRGGSAEDLAGASLVLYGRAGLTVVLAGGPPPRHVSIRAIASGTRGESLRRAAATHLAGTPEVDAPELAVQIARHPSSSPLTDELKDRLRRIWPGSTAHQGSLAPDPQRASPSAAASQ